MTVGANMVVFRDSSDEVTFNFVTDECFERLRRQFNALGDRTDNDALVEQAYQELNNPSNHTHPTQFMQTFCLEKVDFPAVKNLLVLPET